MKASDYIARFIRNKGISAVFELSGGMITHILDSLHQAGGIEIVTMHHEQGAAFAADGFARASGLPGIALATSGPGATNLLTGIGSCYFDSVPGIFITGQVNIHEQKGNRAIRQLGFQETDIVSMAIPVSKKCYRITSAQQLPEVLEEAFLISMAGRPGPVLIDIPMNVQREQIENPSFSISENHDLARSAFSESSLSTLLDVMQKAERPLILAGRGIRAAAAVADFKLFCTKVKVPVVTSLLGLDSISYEDPLRVGFLGSYGNRWANMAIGESDFILVLGSRLDIRQTGSDVAFFERDRTIFHVDCEEGELNNRLKNTISLHGNLQDFFSQILNLCESREFRQSNSWTDRISWLKSEYSDLKELGDLNGNINPNSFMHYLSRHSAGRASAYIADVGNHQMWAAQSLELSRQELFITSGGMGAMGFALPAAIGIYFANKKPNVMISGDGGFQLNIQELQTIYRNQLPVKMVVINNQNLGMIRQFQDSYFESRYQSTFWGYSPPDFEKVALAYGIDSATISFDNEIEKALEKLWEFPEKPFLLQVMVGSYVNAYPKIAFGKPLTEMEPEFKPLEMEGT